MYTSHVLDPFLATPIFSDPSRHPAFMIYMSIRRPQIAKSNPKNVNGENSRILAREWTWFMPDVEKQYWLDLADDYRDEFKRRFPSFQYRRTTDYPGQTNSKKRRLSDSGDDEGRRVRPAPYRAFSSNAAVIRGWPGYPTALMTPQSDVMALTPSVLAPTRGDDYFAWNDRDGAIGLALSNITGLELPYRG
jgi:hypothetical protein